MGDWLGVGGIKAAGTSRGCNSSRTLSSAVLFPFSSKNEGLGEYVSRGWWVKEKKKCQSIF